MGEADGQALVVVFFSPLGSEGLAGFKVNILLVPFD